ncbi:hypothetical protein NECID01_2094, partial [Nematocida sp. AWRm77]
MKIIRACLLLTLALMYATVPYIVARTAEKRDLTWEEQYLNIVIRGEGSYIELLEFKNRSEAKKDEKNETKETKEKLLPYMMSGSLALCLILGGMYGAYLVYLQYANSQGVNVDPKTFAEISQSFPASIIDNIAGASTITTPVQENIPFAVVDTPEISIAETVRVPEIFDNATVSVSITDLKVSKHMAETVVAQEALIFNAPELEATADVQ